MIISNSAGEQIIYPELRLNEVDTGLRLKNTLTTFGKVGGITLLCIFIPVLHFILVPVGLILTIYLTYSAYKKNYDLKNIEIHCPSCDKKSTQSVSGTELPIRTICPYCGQMVYLSNEHKAS
ncbi:MAG: hypothetical protein H6623_00015 [Bdellovibrionaceae bacterium]|nr:hypothetical protein [Pseudobdellovibrionaceae bacterium]